MQGYTTAASHPRSGSKIFCASPDQHHRTTYHDSQQRPPLVQPDHWNWQTAYTARNIQTSISLSPLTDNQLLTIQFSSTPAQHRAHGLLSKNRASLSWTSYTALRFSQTNTLIR